MAACDTPHKFYSKSTKEQNSVLLKIGGAALAFNLAVLALSMFSGLFMLFILSVVITLSVIAPFFDVPPLKKSGKLIYYSALFIAEKENKGTIIIHGGSLFDYVFVLDNALTGTQRTQFVLQQYLAGLLKLMDACNEKGQTLVKIKGTSYVLNERTAEKIGLKAVKTDFVQKLLLTYNYVNILVSNSFAKKKLSFPNLRNVKTFEAEIGDLLERRTFIEGVNNKLIIAMAKSQN